MSDEFRIWFKMTHNWEFKRGNGINYVTYECMHCGREADIDNESHIRASFFYLSLSGISVVLNNGENCDREEMLGNLLK